MLGSVVADEGVHDNQSQHERMRRAVATVAEEEKSVSCRHLWPFTISNVDLSNGEQLELQRNEAAASQG